MPEPTDTTDGESQSVIPFRLPSEEDSEIVAEDDESVVGDSGGQLSSLRFDEDEFGELVDEDSSQPLALLNTQNDASGRRVALVGRFASMNRRQATNVLQSYNAHVIDYPKAKADGVDWVVIGDEQPPLSQSDLLDASIIQAAGRGDIEIMNESELWQRLGLVDVEQSIRRFHTPAMLADLLGVSVRVIRRWHRRGLITPIVTVHRLPYFDFAEVSTAKRLAGWIAAGASPTAIERRLAELVEVLPNIRRPLDQLSILVEGKQILLRQGDGLIEPGGQMRFDFDALEAADGSQEQHEVVDDVSDRSTIAFEIPDQPPMLRAVSQSETDPVLVAAYEAEDEDDLETAVELYHTILARDGARADIAFQIGELLYRMNFLVAARERYYTAIELDPDFVEARASLGAVLSELGQHDLAIAALRGTLKMYDEYADVHYTLAKTLDRVGRDIEAEVHWNRCHQLSPESPWATEAKERLGLE